MTRHVIALLLTIATLLGAFPAWAVGYSVNFCAKYNIDFNDAGTTVGDDYFTDDSVNLDAHGTRIRVRRNSDSYDVFDTYTDWSGSNAGCTGNLNCTRARRTR